MRRLRHKLVRPLLFALLLVLGPLNAQTVFACMMMGGVELETCCCDDHGPAMIAFDDTDQPCCETAVELRMDQSSDRDNPIAKPLEVRSDSDPPPAVLIANPINVRLDRAFTHTHRIQTWSITGPGSQTYLFTQRLRI